VRAWLDELLLSTLTRDWDKRQPGNYSKMLQQSQAATPQHIHDAFMRIDSKSTALLTYVAMIIAGLGICAPIVAEHPVEEGIVIAQISLFLLIAVGCLRCLSVFASPTVLGDAADLPANLERELIIRQELFRLCHRASIVFTLGVFISLPAMLLYRPDM
jgi:multisubunit Na+/H+ antiporter MnhG subunit